MNKLQLEDLYLTKQLSSAAIAKRVGCSAHKVDYWLAKYQIPKRTIGDAIYAHHNPDGNPFTIKPIKTQRDAKLLGLGIGLYWGEGTKADKYSVRLGNSDPALLNTFIAFLTELFMVDKTKLRFGLQIFTDIEQSVALAYWSEALDVKPSQFYKIHVTMSGSIGTYRKKSKYGVVTVYFHNKKLRDIIVNMLPT